MWHTHWDLYRNRAAPLGFSGAPELFNDRRAWAQGA